MLIVVFILSMTAVSAANYGWGGFYCTSSSECQPGTACAPVDSQDEPDTFVCQYPSFSTWQTAGNLHGTQTQSANNGTIILTNGNFFYNETTLSGAFTTQPIIADLDNDGKQNLITTNGGTVSVYAMDGNTWTLSDSITLNGTIQYAPYVGNLSFYSRTKSSKQQEIMVVSGSNAYVLDFVRDDLRVVEYANISDVALPSALLNISSNIDCFSVNTTYTACSWKATNQVGSSGYIITVYPSSNSQVPTSTQFKATQQAFYVTDQQFNGTETRRGMNELIITNTTAARPFIYVRSDNYSAIYAYDPLVGALDPTWGDNGIFTYPTFTSGSTTQLYETFQLMASDSRNTGNRDICVLSYTSKNYAGVNWDTYNNVSCYDNTATIKWSYAKHADGNHPQTQLYPYGASVVKHSSYTYPLICQMYVPDNKATTSDRIGFRCDLYSGSPGLSDTAFEQSDQPSNILQNCNAGNIGQLYFCKDTVVSSGSFISGETRPVFAYKNIYFIPNGSGGNYSQYETVFTTDDGSQNLIVVDVIGNLHEDVIRWNASMIYTDIGGSTPAENINYTPLYINPLVQNGTWWGYYTIACENSTITLHGNECNPATNQPCSYYNEPLHQERLGTTCDGTQALTWGSLSPDSPEVSCTFNSTGAKSIRVFLADDRNPTSTAVYDTVTDVNILVATTSCNQPSDYINQNMTSIINPANPIQPGGGGGGGGNTSCASGNGGIDCLFAGLDGGSSSMNWLFGVGLVLAILVTYLKMRSDKMKVHAPVSAVEIIIVCTIGLVLSCALGFLSWWIFGFMGVLFTVILIVGRFIAPTQNNG